MPINWNDLGLVIETDPNGSLSGLTWEKWIKSVESIILSKIVSNFLIITTCEDCLG